MVLHLQQKHLILTTTFLKETLELRFKLKKYPLRSYKNFDDVADMIGQSRSEFRKRITTSKSLHGIIVNGNFMLHPDSAIEVIKRGFKKTIASVLAEPF